MAIIAYAVAMAYLEAAVVVYLQHALAIEPAACFRCAIRARPAAWGHRLMDRFVTFASCPVEGSQRSVTLMAWTA